MATKPSRVFEWSTDFALGDDDTRRLDIPADWKTDGVEDDDRFLHEYANDTFGLISSWTVYLDDLSIEQTRGGNNGEIVLTRDDASVIRITLGHTGAGVSAWEADLGLFTAYIAVGDQVTNPGTAVAKAEAVETNGAVNNNHARLVFAHVEPTSDLSCSAPVFEPTLLFADAVSETQATSTPGKTLYLDNLVKGEFTIAVNTSTGTITLEGYNVRVGDTAPVLSGTVMRVRLQDIDGVKGNVHAALNPTPGAACAVPKILALYDAGNEWIEISSTVTTTADLTTDVNLVSSGAVNTSAPAGIYRIHLTLY